MRPSSYSSSYSPSYSSSEFPTKQLPELVRSDANHLTAFEFNAFD